MAPIPNPHGPAREPARAEPERRREAEPRRAEPREARPESKPEARPAPPPAPAVDPARAAKLRAQGLEQLNRGRVDRATALLAQAHALDPDNPLIRRDLDRAERISRAVHARR